MARSETRQCPCRGSGIREALAITGGPCPPIPSPGLHTKHAAFLGTEDPKFWLAPGGTGQQLAPPAISHQRLRRYQSLSEGAPGLK